MNATSIPALTSWMGSLPETLRLSQLSIPGTHDSCSLYSGLSMGFAQTQTIDIDSQLKKGIRYLDIRCRNIPDHGNDAPGTFRVYHGPVPQHRTFDEVLDDCIDFLSINTKETIIMRVQQEQSRDDDLYTRIFLKYLERRGRDKFYLRPVVPTLKEAQGKIVLLTANPHLGEGLNFYGQQIQDDFENPEIADKQKKVVDHMTHSKGSSGVGLDKLYINHLSATGFGSVSTWTPWHYAKIMNKFALEKIRSEFSASVQLGVIIHDYAGSSRGVLSNDIFLPRAIIARNNFPAPSSDSLTARHHLIIAP